MARTSRINQQMQYKIVERQNQSDELSSKCDLLHADLDEKARTISMLQSDNEKAESKLEKRGDEYCKDLDEW